MPYLIYDLVPQTVLDGWTVIGKFMVLLWHTVIEEKEVYLCWIQAGKSIAVYIAEHPEQCCLLGLPMKKLQTPGFVYLPTHMENGKFKVVLAVEWRSTQMAAVAQPGSHQNIANDLFHKCKALVTKDSNKASIGSHYSIGNIVKILVPNQKHIASHITVSCLEFLPGLHPQLNVPCLKFPTPEHKVLITPESSLLKNVKNIFCTVNVQHDYASLGAVCDKVQNVQEQQEHSEIMKKRLVIDHALTNMYLVNVHALHNYWRIATAIPEEVQAQRNTPRPLDYQLVHEKKAMEPADIMIPEGRSAPTNSAVSPPALIAQPERQKAKGERLLRPTRGQEPQRFLGLQWFKMRDGSSQPITRRTSNYDHLQPVVPQPLGCWQTYTGQFQLSAPQPAADRLPLDSWKTYTEQFQLPAPQPVAGGLPLGLQLPSASSCSDISHHSAGGTVSTQSCPIAFNSGIPDCAHCCPLLNPPNESAHPFQLAAFNCFTVPTGSRRKWNGTRNMQLFSVNRLAAGSLDDFAMLDEARMLLHIQATLLAKNKIERRAVAIAFIKSDEFKSYAKKNLTTFKIPVEAIEDSEMLDYISTMMKDILTSQ
ncbi:hypothetical protein BS17DRAFT_767598 [Gyrodon lividus]|nr:hypothetical protein BS17DRAFT_767598 [Gyrodon lividus]